MRLHLAEIQKLKENKRTGFGMIWGRLSQGSRDVLENSSTDPAAPPFSTILEARDDPLELLRRVITTHLTIAGPNNEVHLMNGRTTFSRLQMNRTETLISFYSRFTSTIAALDLLGVHPLNDAAKATEFVYRLDHHRYAKAIIDYTNGLHGQFSNLPTATPRARFRHVRAAA